MPSEGWVFPDSSGAYPPKRDGRRSGIDRIFQEALDRTFDLREQEGEDKVVSLQEAIAAQVRPGMRLHFSREANAAALEVLRQFQGTDPRFTVVMGGTLGYVWNLIHYNLVETLITSMSTHLHPTPGPVRMLQGAVKEKRLRIENWSMWTLIQRLIAGAWGVPFLPTNSLLGTGMAQENGGLFQEMVDPFGSGRKCGLVKSLEEIKGRIIALIRTFTLRDYYSSLRRAKRITQRQYDLVIILLENAPPFSLTDLFIKHPFNILYRSVTERTARRDLKRLRELRLLSVVEGRYFLNVRVLE